MRKSAIANKRSIGRQRTVQILQMIAIGALVIGLGGAPSPRAMNRLLKEFTLGDTRENRRYVSRKVRNMKKQGYLAKHGVRYAVSDKGSRILSAAELENLRIPRQQHWNGTWHLVLFDIPLPESSARKAFNRILLGLGLVQYQQSVLVYPFPIRDTVLPICRFYGITKYVSFISAENIDGSEKLTKHFGLK
ncbi:MAG: hypothetical protein NUV59_04175 [Patescibacteria group bacterium]|nr:hypothetical protein [Patescibacteria group bacterium]